MSLGFSSVPLSSNLLSNTHSKNVHTVACVSMICMCTMLGVWWGEWVRGLLVLAVVLPSVRDVG